MRELLHYLNATGRLITWLTCRTSGRFLLGAIAHAGARILQLATFFLPLKILIMLSNEGPLDNIQMFSPVDLGKHSLTLFMIAVPAAYAGYLILGYLARRLTDDDMLAQERIALTEQSAPLSMPKDLKKIHTPCTQIASEMLLITAIMLFAVILHPAIFLAFALILLSSLFLHCKYTFRTAHDQRLTRLHLHRHQYVEYVTATSFIFIFFTLAGTWSNLNLDVFSGLLLLLGGRMCCQAIQRIATSTLRLPAKHYRF